MAIAGRQCWYFSKPDERQGALDKAQKCIEITIEIAPTSWHTHATKAFRLWLMGEVDEAASEFGISLVLNRFMTESYPPFLSFLIETGSAEAAGLLESRALELFRNPELQAMHGQMLERSGYPDKAEAHYREALELDPDNGLCHLVLAGLLEHQGRLDEAKVHFQRAEVLLGARSVALWQSATAFGNGQT